MKGIRTEMKEAKLALFVDYVVVYIGKWKNFEIIGISLYQTEFENIKLNAIKIKGSW